MINTPAPQLRASDGDRDTVIEVLNEAFRTGRISSDEHTERVTAALGAKTFSELNDLTVDLVPGGTFGLHTSTESGHDARGIGQQAGYAGSILPTEPLVLNTVFNKLERRGNWEVPGRLRLNALMATVELDLTQARRSTRTIEIDCSMIVSTLKVAVPAGSQVRDDARRIASEISIKRLGPTDADPLVLVLTGTLTMSDVKVRGPRGRNSFRDFLGH